MEVIFTMLCTISLIGVGVCALIVGLIYGVVYCATIGSCIKEELKK